MGEGEREREGTGVPVWHRIVGLIGVIVIALLMIGLGVWDLLDPVTTCAR